MEIREFSLRLGVALRTWQEEAGDTNAQALQKEIEFAFKNGIDLQLKIPKNVLQDGDESPLTRGQFMDLINSTDDRNFIFVAPSEKNMSATSLNRKYSLKVIKNGSYGNSVELSQEGIPLVSFDRLQITTISSK